MAELVGLERVYTDGYHNAFTDLLHWQGSYYLTFRTAEHHGFPPDGDVVVMRSEDLRSWDVCALISTGGDDRDPKLIDAGDRLAIVFATWYPRWSTGSLPNTPSDLISHIIVSRDGTCWSSPRQVYGVNYWLWRVFPLEGGYLCPAYHFAVRADRLMRTVHLLHSDDLLDWRLKGLMREGGGCGEPVLFQMQEGTLSCIFRSLEPDNHSWIGHSKAPYTDWRWSDLGAMIHAPVVLDVGGMWICAGRSQPQDLPPGTVEPDSGAHTSIWRIDSDAAEHLLTVPSLGDCSYCGLAHGPDGEVVMSYYSQHEWAPLPQGQPTPADVFLARLRV